MASKRHVGTSAFTHQDDATAPVHTSDPEHLGAHIFGGDAPDVERSTTVLGPPAFGSPDVRTLGHIMHPDVKSESAPALDEEFLAIQGSQSGSITEDDLDSMSKKEVKALAENLGVDVNNSMTKQDLIEAIKDEYEVNESAGGQGGTEDETADDENAGDNTTDDENAGDDDSGSSY